MSSDTETAGVRTFTPPSPVTIDFKVSRREMRSWVRLFARLSGQPPREVRRMPPSRVANAAYHRRQRNRIKRRRR